MVQTLDRVDRNRSFREARISWEPLPLKWVTQLFMDDAPSPEARLAMVMVSGFPVARPFTTYRFGAEFRGTRFEHPERPPARWVWNAGALSRVLGQVLAGRVLDWERAEAEGRRDRVWPGFALSATAGDVGQWLNSQVDEESLAGWISRLAVFNWNQPKNVLHSLTAVRRDETPADPELCLFGWFQPLFNERPLRVRLAQRVDALDPNTGARTAGAARAIAGLLNGGRVDAAVMLAGARYAMAGLRLIRNSVTWGVAEPERLLASLLFSVTDREETDLIERWLRPRRQERDETHV
jgi:CRISPR-associated protein Csx17